MVLLSSRLSFAQRWMIGEALVMKKTKPKHLARRRRRHPRPKSMHLLDHRGPKLRQQRSRSM